MHVRVIFQAQPTLLRMIRRNLDGQTRAALLWLRDLSDRAPLEASLLLRAFCVLDSGELEQEDVDVLSELASSLETLPHVWAAAFRLPQDLVVGPSGPCADVGDLAAYIREKLA